MARSWSTYRTRTEEHSYKEWIDQLFPNYFGLPLADRHHAFWEWLWAIQPGVRPKPFIAIWPREGGKSTNAEAAVVALGARNIRPYVWYVRETQDQADGSVQNIADMLESHRVARRYPLLASREIGKYGQSKGWRRNRVRTASGFTVDAIGLDTARRGARIKENRPSVLIFDDIDGKHDSERATQKKLEIITTSLLPAGSDDAIVMGLQNLITDTGVFAMLAGVHERPAGFLTDRIISGPYPAIENLELETTQDPETGRIRAHIIGGEPTWEGQDVARCQRYIETWGVSAFLSEAQHEVGNSEFALWDKELLDKTRVDQAKDVYRVVVAIDPPAGPGQCGIVVAGVAMVKDELHGYVLDDRTTLPGAKPDEWGKAAIQAYKDYNADLIVAEINNGGDMVENTIRTVQGDTYVNYGVVRATRGKAVRAEPIASIHAEGRIHIVGRKPELERQLTRWSPMDPESPDRLDAFVWAMHELMLGGVAVSTDYI